MDRFPPPLFLDLGTRAKQKLEIPPITTVSIAMPHLAALRRLPLHHRDPFDRLIIAQATAENVPVISRDAAFAQYDVTVLWQEA